MHAKAGTAPLKKAFFAAIGAIFAAFGATAEPAAMGDLSYAVSAYRAGDYGAAWDLSRPAAAAGDLRAKRYVAYMLIEGETPARKADDPLKGVELLIEAARAGDNAALIRLEELRQSGLAHAPSLDDIIGVEIARAENGDPVTAWRLAKRYESGDGVAPSQQEAIKWLTVAAETDQSTFPKSDEAAFKLCAAFASGSAEIVDPEMALHWCAHASARGNATATIVLRRLAQLGG